MRKITVQEKSFCNSDQAIFAKFGSLLIQKIDKQANKS